MSFKEKQDTGNKKKRKKCENTRKRRKDEEKINIKR